eukprot:1727849-Pleurochrysis_carterae.AAC.1
MRSSSDHKLDWSRPASVFGGVWRNGCAGAQAAQRRRAALDARRDAARERLHEGASPWCKLRQACIKCRLAYASP